MKLDWSGGGLAEGLRCYRKEEFFAAHEHWESVWLGSQEPEKAFLQAVIQVAAAFHHLQRGNPEGGRSLLRRALRRLGAYPASFGGIGVAAFREEVLGWLETLEAGGATAERTFPEIRLEG